MDIGDSESVEDRCEFDFEEQEVSSEVDPNWGLKVNWLPGQRRPEGWVDEKTERLLKVLTDIKREDTINAALNKKFSWKEFKIERDFSDGVLGSIRRRAAADSADGGELEESEPESADHPEEEKRQEHGVQAEVAEASASGAHSGGRPGAKHSLGYDWSGGTGAGVKPRIEGAVFKVDRIEGETAREYFERCKHEYKERRGNEVLSEDQC